MEKQELIGKYKSAIANITILVVALFIAAKIYQVQMQKISLIQKQADEELKKNQLLKNIGERANKLKAYADSINNKDLSSIINTIGELAVVSGVEVTSIRPASEQAEEAKVFTRYPYELKLAADNYHNIGNFIAQLESHKDIFLVESITISPVSGYGSSVPDKINADLRMSTILLNKY